MVLKRTCQTCRTRHNRFTESVRHLVVWPRKTRTYKGLLNHVRECAKMANKFPTVLFLVLACSLLTEGHISVPKVKGIEPRVIEIPHEGLPLSLVRNKRQQFGNVSHIGVTARLNNDSHNVAVVHWSGYPSEVS